MPVDRVVVDEQDAPGFGVRLTEEAVAVSAYAAEWLTPYTPAVKAVWVATVSSADREAPAFLEAVARAVAKAREARLATYRTCSRCGQTNPPEWMHNADTCQSCAVRHLGVVY
ncbi:hypothetical protein LCGC14_2584670 [marine sediment metagenome]|uniref:Uncharacterized protein n=1 Tax=marine sediment metagenome TaxID=412755 RepID=A0A0F9ADB4_9ZZZZ